MCYFLYTQLVELCLLYKSFKPLNLTKTNLDSISLQLYIERCQQLHLNELIVLHPLSTSISSLCDTQYIYGSGLGLYQGKNLKVLKLSFTVLLLH